jgi:hypothetical protein
MWVRRADYERLLRCEGELLQLRSQLPLEQARSERLARELALEVGKNRRRENLLLDRALTSHGKYAITEDAEPVVPEKPKYEDQMKVAEHKPIGERGATWEDFRFGAMQAGVEESQARQDWEMSLRDGTEPYLREIEGNQ